MRVLILGGGGMLGHQLWRELNPSHDVWVTLRKPVKHYAHKRLFDPAKTLDGVDVSDPTALSGALLRAKPEVVVNCVGIIKQLKEASNPILSLTINALLPHQLAQRCETLGARLFHISTDCVFSGRTGQYTEKDQSDADDLYGRTKFLGELHQKHCLTLRTSIIGRELESRLGLIEWFLSQEGQRINGFRRAIFSGLTTMELARVITRMLKRPDISGLWHVSSEPISKYDLLMLAKGAFEWKGEIVPDDGFVCDRSLDSSAFREVAGYQPPDWPAMMAELSASGI